MSQVTRVTFGPEGFESQEAIDAHQQHTPDRTRVHTGAIRYGNGNESAESMGGVTRYSVSHAGTPGGSVLATLRTDGQRPSVETIPGQAWSRTGVTEAIRDGLLRRDAAGNLEDVPNQQEAVERIQKAPAPQQHEDPGREVFSPKLDAMWAEEIALLPQHAYDASLARMTGYLAHGVGDVDDMARSLARDVPGMEPSQAKDTILNGLFYFGEALSAAMKPMGIEGERLDQFLDDCRRNRPGQLQQAVQMLTHMRDASGFAKLAVGFDGQNPPPEAQAMKAAGWQVARDPTGGWLVRPKDSTGGWQPLAAVLKGAKG
jgi:hypothetical protein